MFPVWREACTRLLVDSGVRILVTPITVGGSMSPIFGRSCTHAFEGWFRGLLWQEQSGERFRTRPAYFLDYVRGDRKSILVWDSFSMCVPDLWKNTVYFEDVYHKTWKAQVLCDWQENPTAPGRGVEGGVWAHSCLAWVGPLPSHTRSFCQLPVSREDSAVRTLHCFCNYGRFQSTFN